MKSQTTTEVLTQHHPMVIAIALSLYGYNVGPYERAKKLYDHFGGDCMEIDDLVTIMNSSRLAFAATELPYPTAEVYIVHALEKYGREAIERMMVNTYASISDRREE